MTTLERGRVPVGGNSDLEAGWPCQRLRLGFGMILFFFFEVLIGKQLPQAIPIIALGIGTASLISAFRAIHAWKLTAQLAMIMRALEHRA